MKTLKLICIGILVITVLSGCGSKEGEILTTTTYQDEVVYLTTQMLELSQDALDIQTSNGKVKDIVEIYKQQDVILNDFIELNYNEIDFSYVIDFVKDKIEYNSYIEDELLKIDQDLEVTSYEFISALNQLPEDIDDDIIASYESCRNTLTDELNLSTDTEEIELYKSVVNFIDAVVLI